MPSHPGSRRRAGLWPSSSRDCLGCSMWRGCRSSHSGRADDFGTVHELGDCGLWGSSQLIAVVNEELWAIAQHLKDHCNVEMSKSKDLITSVKFFQILKQRGEEEEPCNAEVDYNYNHKRYFDIGCHLHIDVDIFIRLPPSTASNLYKTGSHTQTV